MEEKTQPKNTPPNEILVTKENASNPTSTSSQKQVQIVIIKNFLRYFWFACSITVLLFINACIVNPDQMGDSSGAIATGGGGKITGYYTQDSSFDWRLAEDFTGQPISVRLLKIEEGGFTNIVSSEASYPLNSDNTFTLITHEYSKNLIIEMEFENGKTIQSILPYAPVSSEEIIAPPVTPEDTMLSEIIQKMVAHGQFASSINSLWLKDWLSSDFNGYWDPEGTSSNDIITDVLAELGLEMITTFQNNLKNPSIGGVESANLSQDLKLAYNQHLLLQANVAENLFNYRSNPELQQDYCIKYKDQIIASYKNFDISATSYSKALYATTEGLQKACMKQLKEKNFLTEEILTDVSQLTQIDLLIKKYQWAVLTTKQLLQDTFAIAEDEYQPGITYITALDDAFNTYNTQLESLSESISDVPSDTTEEEIELATQNFTDQVIELFQSLAPEVDVSPELASTELIDQFLEEISVEQEDFKDDREESNKDPMPIQAVSNAYANYYQLVENKGNVIFNINSVKNTNPILYRLRSTFLQALLLFL